MHLEHLDEIDKKTKKIPVGISSSVVVENVRYDDRHKRDNYILEVLSEYFEWKKICPEMELGLDVPRSTIRLENQSGTSKLIDSKTGTEHTKNMQAFAKKIAHKLKSEEIYGYIFKARPPTFGPDSKHLTDAETEKN